ncbi:transglycosylase domain-containing protein [Streptomyces sp. e14]|uniref:transglycosylase domain-containing protein n=1 Tax=Streptomyces sp. e14 TaxID=645465 RepID=UPI0018CD07A0|nr:transglycosylase domain-containing protein [Streptomyces sp. e14]
MQLNVDALRKRDGSGAPRPDPAPPRPDETMQLKVDALREQQRRTPSRPDGEQPETGRPDAKRPIPEQPGGMRTDGEQSDGKRPDGEQPGRTRPDGEQPGGKRPQPHETMQLRVFRPRAADRPQGQRADRRKAQKKRQRRTLPPALAALTAAAGRRLAPLTRRLAPLLAVLAPYARKLKPVYPRPGRTGWRRWMPSWRQWAGAVFASLGLTSLLLVVAYAATDIPDNLNSYATQQDNVYFWSDGTPMARTGWVQRQAMPLKDIPEDVRWAVLAAENESFYSDPGISFKGITRALWRTVGEGDTEGGSTITQQYVKNVYLTQNQTVSRKFTEAMIALKLDNRMSKDKILEGYLNTSWFGRGTYGIQRAAQAYYGKDVSRLNVSEAAFLGSLLKGAGLYDPTLNPKNHARAVERWNWILDRMVKIGKLSPDERAKYTTFPEPLKSNPLADTGQQSDYLVELATQYAKKAAHISDKDFDLGGYQIYTTFDRKREATLTDVVTKARKEAKEKDPAAAKTAHYGAASVATDGRIVAVYGGPDHRTQGYNESNSSTVPAGSAFQPFVYAAGLQNGAVKQRDAPREAVTPDSVYDGDDAVPVTTPEGPYWDRSGRKVAAHNDGGKSYGRITLRQALAQSVNTPFMQLGMDTGLDKVKQTAVAAGLLPSSMGPQVPDLSLGSSTPSAIRMAGGYATFADGGMSTEPYSVVRVTRNGAAVPLDRPAARRAVSATVAQQVNDALGDAFRTAHPADAPAGAQVTGKAGTTEKDTAAWYVGTAKSVSTAVVVYRMDLAKSLEPLPLKGLAGTSADGVPYSIWAGAMAPLG